MKEIEQALTEELEDLRKIQSQAKEDLKKSPKGSLRVSRNKNKYQYYHRQTPQSQRGTYIRKSDDQLICSLAQKSYAQEILRKTEERIQVIQQFLQQYPRLELKKAYEELSAGRKLKVSPYILPDWKYIENWKAEKKKITQAQAKEGKYWEINTEIYAEKGEQVRSKSEKILADKFYTMNIPYAYEVPLYLKGYGYVRPDFTLLNPRTREEFYWEHLGMMGDSQYCDKAVNKIENYARNNIFTGQKLILSYETENHPLNTKNVEKMIREFLL